MYANPTPHRDGLTPPSLPHASNRLSTVHDSHPTSLYDLQQQREPSQPGLTVDPLVPGWPSQLSAGGIQSP